MFIGAKWNGVGSSDISGASMLLKVFCNGALARTCGPGHEAEQKPSHSADVQEVSRKLPGSHWCWIRQCLLQVLFIVGTGERGYGNILPHFSLASS